LVEIYPSVILKANRSNVYRTLKAFDISRVPKEQKEKAKKLKADLNRFLIYYNTNRRVKSWFEIEPQNFKISPDTFYATLLNGMA